MKQENFLIQNKNRNLKWHFLDPLEALLMVLCGLLLAGFVCSVFLDVLTRTLHHPWLWLQEVTSIQFIYCVFLGAAVAVRRNDHLLLTAIAESLTGNKRTALESFNRVVMLCVAICMCYFGSNNFLHGFGSFRMPSMTPIAYWYLAIPISGAIITLFVIEQLVNGLINGYDHETIDELARN
jgi:TRAP-type C4-dicarboxylate transport system permease small subunit